MTYTCAIVTQYARETSILDIGTMVVVITLLQLSQVERLIKEREERERERERKKERK